MTKMTMRIEGKIKRSTGDVVETISRIHSNKGKKTGLTGPLQKLNKEKRKEIRVCIQKRKAPCHLVYLWTVYGITKDSGVTAVIIRLT